MTECELHEIDQALLEGVDINKLFEETSAAIKAATPYMAAAMNQMASAAAELVKAFGSFAPLVASPEFKKYCANLNAYNRHYARVGRELKKKGKAK
jgi:hypothetical protein